LFWRLAAQQPALRLNKAGPEAMCKLSREGTTPRPGVSIGRGLLGRNRMCSSRKPSRSTQITIIDGVGHSHNLLSAAVDNADSEFVMKHVIRWVGQAILA